MYLEDRCITFDHLFDDLDDVAILVDSLEALQLKLAAFRPV